MDVASMAEENLIMKSIINKYMDDDIDTTEKAVRHFLAAASSIRRCIKRMKVKYPKVELALHVYADEIDSFIPTGEINEAVCLFFKFALTYKNARLAIGVDGDTIDEERVLSYGCDPW